MPATATITSVAWVLVGAVLLTRRVEPPTGPQETFDGKKCLLHARGFANQLMKNKKRSDKISLPRIRTQKILKTADEVFATADMIVKVKEPQPSEIKRLRSGQTLFTYLHLAPDAAELGKPATNVVRQLESERRRAQKRLVAALESPPKRKDRSHRQEILRRLSAGEITFESAMRLLKN